MAATRPSVSVLFPRPALVSASMASVPVTNIASRPRGMPVVEVEACHRSPLTSAVAMDLLQAGVDGAVIALWLGHE